MSEKKSVSTLLSQFVAINSKPTKETFPELPEIVVWFRFTLAVLYGGWLGMSTAERSGGANAIFGLNFVTFVPWVYCSTFLGADQESYNNRLLFAGVINSVGLLMLIWIYLYTSAHEDDENTLVLALTSVVNAAADAAVGGTGEGDAAGRSIGGEGGASSTQPVVEQSEF